MKLLWTRELDAQNPWEPEFHGIFSYQESGISFYYKDEHLSAKLIFTSFVVFVNGSLDTCLFLHSGCLYIQRQA